MKPKSPHPPSTITTHTGLRIMPHAISLTITKQNKLHKSQELALAADAVVHGELAKPEEVKTTLLQLIKQTGPPDKFVTLGIPEHQTFLKKITVSSWKGSNREAVLSELESHLPLPMDQLYVDWLVLPSSDSLQVAAIPKTVIDPYMQVVSETGLTVLAIESTSLTLLRLADKLEATTIIIDAEPTATLVIAEPDHNSSITAVAQSTGNELPEDFNQVFNDLKTYYLRQSPQPITKILITGKFADQAMKLVGIEPPPTLLPLTLGNSAQQLGIALATMPIAPPEHPQTINLIPPTIQANYDQAAVHHLKHRIFLISAIGLVIGNLIAAIFLFQILRQQPPLSNSEQPMGSSSLDQLNQVNTINQQALAIVEIAGQRQAFTQTVTDLLSHIPIGLQVNYLKFDAANKTATMRGKAGTRDQLLNFKDQLQQNPNITNVNLPLSVLDKNENIEFNLTFKWQGKK